MLPNVKGKKERHAISLPKKKNDNDVKKKKKIFHKNRKIKLEFKT